ncbi:MAG: hypothetical protein II458_09360 [Oscillospiraceae bacterium]|nr:hypothetical protein [Oscillospiraceae bacterium]
MQPKEIALWVGFLVICAVIYLVSNRMKKQIEEDGIETTGVISRITETGAQDEITLHYYALYRTEDGEEVEGLLSNPRSDLVEGQQVRIKYHPKHKANARLVNR